MGQETYWNMRVQQVSGNYGLGLTLSPNELAFQRKHIKEGGDTLVLGATPALCSLALDISHTVTTVDFADMVIENAKAIISHPRRHDVVYIFQDWLAYFSQTSAKFDSIVTDGGLLCLNYPDAWDEIISQIYAHLKPTGTFIAKAYVSLEHLPDDTNANPNLARFMSIPTNAAKDWEVTPTHGDYADHEVHYSLPPKEVVLQKFSRFGLVDELVPEYVESERFPSFAWQKKV